VVRVARILQDYRDAGALNSLLALWGFVDNATFLTKAGHVGLVYSVEGIDCQGLTHAQRRSLAHRFEAALRTLDEHLPRVPVPGQAVDRSLRVEPLWRARRERSD
jgi:hypothetical protein